MDRILQDMIAVLDSIGTYNDKVCEWHRYAQMQAKDKASGGLPQQPDLTWPTHLRLELPPAQATADPATEAGREALQATQLRGLSAKPGPRKTPAP